MSYSPNRSHVTPYDALPSAAAPGIRASLATTLTLFMSLLLVIGASGSALGQQTTAQPGGTFQDDNESIHEADIEAISAAGITKGCNPPANDAFCPDRSVTRGEMAAFLVRALQLGPSANDAFVDDDESIFESEIDALAEAGVTKGCNPPDNDSFCPDQPVLRGQMAAFLTRAYAYSSTTAGGFTDTTASVFQEDIAALAEAGVTRGCNPPENDRFCPGDPVTRQQMASFLVRAEGLVPIPVPDGVSIGFEEFATGLAEPIHLTAPPLANGPAQDRVFISERAGRIRIVENGSLLAGAFLDITNRVNSSGGEMGLLSMAFHPDYATNGRFFVAYSGTLRPGGTGHHTEYLSEFTVSADPNAASMDEKVILAVDQPASNHNGGHVLFGPDGYLYLSLGDGGGGGDPSGNGQNTATLLGSLLRLDVDGAEPYEIPPDNPFVGSPGADEIWSIGLRNPWRFWFDEGVIYVADVGQDNREEVSVAASDREGLNFGWNIQEGTACHRPAGGCDKDGKVQPLVELTHRSGACSITGGVVARGSAIPQINGRYLFADLCLGQIEMVLTDGQQILERTTLPVGRRSGIWSFGTDAVGGVYAVFGGSGSVWKIVPN